MKKITELLTFRGYPHLGIFDILPGKENLRLITVTDLNPIKVGDKFCFGMNAAVSQADPKAVIECRAFTVVEIKEQHPAYGYFKTERPTNYRLIVKPAMEKFIAEEIQLAIPYKFIHEKPVLYARPVEEEQAAA